MSLELHGDDFARGAEHDFAVNVSIEPRPDWVQEAIDRGIRQLGRYPDDRAAIDAVAARHGRDPAEVVLLNGAAEGFTLLAQALRPRSPIVVHPSFSEPERALNAAGLEPARLILESPFELEPAAVAEHADFVVIGNPTNPTGVLHTLDVLASMCRPGRTTVVDEAFMDYVDGEYESLAGPSGLPGVVVVRSLTKILGLPGVRVGYTLAPAPLAQELRRVAPAWPVNTIALSVIEAACARTDYLAEQARRTAACRTQLKNELERLAGIRVYPSSANFLLLEMADATDVHRRLLAENGIAARPGWTFPGLDHRHLRVAIRGEPLDQLLVAALSEVLAPRRHGALTSSERR